jgi:hypothetical protein
MNQYCDCGKEMENLGNISGIILDSFPPQWDETWICRSCKKERTIRVFGETADYSFVKGFKGIE